ncbi:type II toxin-antitoxin system PemK/MazF family toxin [Nodosilinea sp. LEGE 07088]|uniref:type II toxin-antitoxin system PemK/MazF family toxin n=1 Tax=Nodosilinea sp. LEGE 07088 TaxID=2777968 RepID=UPI001882074D|nr:type II toxin-antitoxin system PemK/MazF family toxin [Nodosilinea sp. LEGE 07088]
MVNPSSPRGKVVLVRFPFDDLVTAKVRPALCLTHSIGPYQHVLLAFITSRIPDSPLPTDIIFKPSHPDFVASGLRKPSALRLHYLMTAKLSVILRELGVLSQPTQEKVARRLCSLFIDPVL